MQDINFKNKKVLIFGLGILGGGAATANWLLRQGAKITITDLKNKKQLKEALGKIKGKYSLSLGGHKKSDIDENEVIVVNPDVSIRSEFIKYAYAKGRVVFNEASIFFKNFQKPIIVVTGTRGKTTTTSWINHFLNTKCKSSPAGNSTKFQFLRVLSRRNHLDAAVVEVSSFHLEYFNSVKIAPDVAIITNVYQDHLNRHGTVKNYASVKANIFKNQNKNQVLILNYDNEWTKFFLKLKPKPQIYFFSLKQLPKNSNGIYLQNNCAIFSQNGEKEKVLDLSGFEQRHGKHNLQNLLASFLAAKLFRIDWPKIQKSLKILPSIEFRQEKVFENKKLTIINDTTATSPEGGIAALERFGSPKTILITGGTDRSLNYKGWSKIVLKKIKPQNLIFLSGSSTDKILALLKSKIKNPFVCDNLKTCVIEALKIAKTQKKSIILFSPASKSFEKFKNEFDRGKKFNQIVKRLLKNFR